MDDRKKNNRSLASALLRHVAFLTALAVILLFLSLRPVVHTELRIGLTALIVLSFAGGMVSLLRNVHKPIKKVEEAMDLLSSGKNNIFQALELEEDSAALSMHFYDLIQLLKESLDREYTADILKKEAELNALQSQINPHFLYNVLDAIRGHALMEGVGEIAEMTEALSKLFRYSVSHGESEVTLERELVNVRSYFKIQQYRFNNKFDLRVIIGDDEDKTLGCRIPKLTLQPIIENAIYHGLEMKMDKGLVTIRTRLTEELLLIEINDDGVGLGDREQEAINRSFQDWNHIQLQKKETSGSGIALTNVNSRIKMMYGEEYGLHIYSTRGFGTMIEILLPAGDP